jgi:hypothetical protein
MIRGEWSATATGSPHSLNCRIVVGLSAGPADGNPRKWESDGHTRTRIDRRACLWRLNYCGGGEGGPASLSTPS